MGGFNNIMLTGQIFAQDFAVVKHSFLALLNVYNESAQTNNQINLTYPIGTASANSAKSSVESSVESDHG